MDKSLDDLMTGLMDAVRGATNTNDQMSVEEATEALKSVSTALQTLTVSGSSADGVYTLDTETNTWDR